MCVCVCVCVCVHVRACVCVCACVWGIELNCILVGRDDERERRVGDDSGNSEVRRGAQESRGGRGQRG